MRSIILFLSLLALSTEVPAQSINAVIGDSSWFHCTGLWPDGSEDEQTRITRHLQYVHDVLLHASADEGIKGVQPLLEIRREYFLKELQAYIDSGTYPQYSDYPGGRRPVFIDDAGTLCAVGHLIAMDAGRAEAERINRLYRYHYLEDMPDSTLLAWQAGSGFSLRELAMIQPAYDWEQQPAPPHYVFQDEKTGLYGLKKSKNDRTVIRAQYRRLNYDPKIPFVYGQREQVWDLFKAKGKIIGRDYNRVSLSYKDEKWRAVASDASGTEAFNPRGLSLWRNKYFIMQRTVSDQMLAHFRDNPMRWGVINGDGLVTIDYCDTLIPLYKNGNQLFAWKAQKKIRTTLYLDEDSINHRDAVAPFWFIVDPAGIPLLPDAYTHIDYLAQSFAATDRRGKLHLFSEQGEDFGLKGLKSVRKSGIFNGLLCQFDSLTGLFHSDQGQWFIEPKYTQVFLTNNRFHVRSAKGIGFYDLVGKEVIPAEYEWGQLVYNRFLLKKDGKMELRDFNGDALLPLDYDTIGHLVQDISYPNSHMFFSQKDSVFTIHHYHGQVLYDDIYLGYEPVNRYIVVLHHISGLKYIAQLEHSTFKVYPKIKLDGARHLEAWYAAYILNGKEGLWLTPQGIAPRPEHFRSAIYDTIVSTHYRNDYEFLVRQETGWGVYDVRKDSLVVPCQYEDYYPKDRFATHGQLYFKSGEDWYKHYHAKPGFKHLGEEDRLRIAALWREELAER